jgi:hypothetical protein
VAQSVQHDTWEARHSATWSARKALRGSHSSPNSVVNTNGVLTHGGASRDLLDPLPAAHAPQDAHASWGERHRPPGLLDLGVGGSTSHHRPKPERPRQTVRPIVTLSRWVGV